MSAPALDITKLTSGDIEGLIAVADEMDAPMTYTATVSTAGYITLCVPFDAELPEESEVEVYSLTGVLMVPCRARRYRPSKPISLCC